VEREKQNAVAEYVYEHFGEILAVLVCSFGIFVYFFFDKFI